MAQSSLTGLHGVQEQSPIDFYKSGLDETKCIEGTIKMTWDKLEHDTRSLEALVVIGEHRFQVFFQLCEKYLEVLQALQPRDKFRLSLRGAKFQELNAKQDHCTLPLSLLFSDGVELEWKRPDGNVQKLNTWIDHDEHLPGDENSWYMSPQGDKEVSGSNPLRAPKRHHDETETVAQPKELHNDTGQREKISQAEKKRRRLEAKEKCIAEQEQLKRSSTASLSSVMDTHASYTLSRSSDGATGSVKVEHSVPPSQGVSPKLKAGFRSGSTVYPALRDVEKGTSTSLIGVVTGISTPDLTHKGDWMRFVQIVDPSIYDANLSGLRVNCFTKRYVEWLPTADRGDVVILRCVKIVDFRGYLSGTGHYDKLTWAVCSPPGRIHHGPPNKAPREEGLAPGGFGVCFSPFYQPTKEEILYCVKLSDWWREVQKEEQKHLVHVGPSISQQSFAMRRVHRLISEAGPSVPPDGYFDCTVEVLQGYMGENGIYTLFVTDYTCNGQTASVQYNWCPSSLSDKVLRVEMWDSAAQMGLSMKPGEIFCIRNARMMTNQYTGYLQAKLQQNKMMRLKEADADRNPHLQALLERKRQWEEILPNLDNETEHRLIQNFEEDKFLNCTVEILQAVTDNEDSFIYVTDYTSHSLLESLKVDEPWAQGLTGSIVKIFLVEGQKRMIESVKTGSFYNIQKLRWRFSHTDGCIRVQLGGAEKLITMLNPNKTHNEHLNGLLRRKESWEKNILCKIVREKRPHQILQADHHSKAKKRDPACIRIQDIPPPHTGPMQLKVYAKPVSFYPMDLGDAFYQYCARCKVEVPQKHIACLKCGDSDYEYLEIKYQVYLIIEDEYKEQILISINDTSDIWDGLKRVRPPDDDCTAKQLCARLSPLLGNLPLVHQYYSTGQTHPKRTSFFTFELYSWIDDGKRRGYTFLKYS